MRGRGDAAPRRRGLHADRDADRPPHLRDGHDRPNGALRPGHERRGRHEQPLPVAAGGPARARSPEARRPLRVRAEPGDRDCVLRDAHYSLRQRRLRELVHGGERHAVRPLPERRQHLLELGGDPLRGSAHLQFRLLVRRPVDLEPLEAPPRPSGQRTAEAPLRDARARGRPPDAEQHADVHHGLPGAAVLRSVVIDLRRRLARADGFVLPLTLGIITVLAIATTTAIYYTSTNSRNSQTSKASQTAY